MVNRILPDVCFRESHIEVGSKSRLKVMSFKTDVKSKLVRKKSVGSGDKVNKHDKRKSFKRTGSFNNNHRKELCETKSVSLKVATWKCISC